MNPSQPRLAIIENEVHVGRSLCLLLEDMEIKPTHFLSSRDAVTHLLAHPEAYDAVLLDFFHGPEDLQGWEILDLLLDSIPQMPLMVMSGHADFPRQKIEKMQLPVEVPVFEKPLTTADMEQVAERSRLRTSHPVT